MVQEVKDKNLLQIAKNSAREIGYKTVGAYAFLAVFAVVITVTFVLSQTRQTILQHAAGNSNGCKFLSAPGTVSVFCDSFDAPANTTGNRSGDLDGNIWGVSRYTQGQNPSGLFDAWGIPTLDLCGTNITAAPPNDVRICNGQLREAVNDLGNVVALAMYPKQPFDFTGRTGTIVFDISNDTQGSHTAWPEVWITDKPIPAPLNHPTQVTNLPVNGLGITLEGTAGLCPDGFWTIGSYVVVTNHEANTIAPSNVDCVKEPAGPDDALNHVEIRVSQSQIDVYATDPGGSTLKHISTLPNANLPITKGLVWMNDAHYNGNKDGHTQGNHTFTWDNVGFDGPYTYRDVATDVLDGTGSCGTDCVNLGFPPSTTLKTQPISSTAISKATSALTTFNLQIGPGDSRSFTLNGHSHTTTNTSSGWVMSWAIPVPVSEVVSGANTLVFDDEVQNVDIILVAAGDAPTSQNNCGLQKGGSTAFCETFDAPAGTGNRSGQLN